MKDENISLFELLKKDFDRKYQALPFEYPNNKLKLFLMFLNFTIFYKSFRSILFYRLSNRFHNQLFVNIFYVLKWITFSIEIPSNAQIGEGFLIGHPDGIVINGNCIIGKNFSIYQGVTIGGNMGKIKNGQEAPIIGDNVFVGAGAKILGPVKIGDNCIIGANAVVINNIPKNSVAVGIPAKVIKRVNDNYIEIEKNYKNKILKKKYHK